MPWRWARRLPAILPLVLHHSEAGWVSPTTMHGIVDLDADAMSVVGNMSILRS